MKQQMECCLQVLSPLHIGCDEAYEPTSFTLDEQACRLIVFDPFDFLKTLSPADKGIFSEICRQGKIESILEIYKFMRGRLLRGRPVDVVPGLVEHYRKTLAISLRDKVRVQKELNNFTISRTSFKPNDNQPYIPGSAVKGALRTAFLNMQAAGRKIPTPKGRFAAKELEKKLMNGGSFQTDPFSKVKVSDFMALGEIGTTVVYAVNRKKKPSKYEARGPYQILEIVQSGSLFQGTITLETPPPQSGVTLTVTWESLLQSAVNFYEKEYQREKQSLSAIEVSTSEPPKGNGEWSSLLRLGRHSGAECVTIEGHRDIRIMQGGGKQAKFGQESTTLWLASPSGNPVNNHTLQPFGWALLQPLANAPAARGKTFTATIHSISEASTAPIKQAASAVQEPAKAEEIKPPATEIWDGANLSWNPGNRTVAASFENKKATCQGKELVPESLHPKLFGKKKSATAKVEVEPIGNAFKIVGIECLV